VAGLPLPGFRRMAEPVWSTRLQTSLTVLNYHPLSWLLEMIDLHQVVTHKTSSCAVCRYKTIFPLVSPTKLKNNVSKMLIVKVIDCLQLSDTKTRDEEK